MKRTYTLLAIGFALVLVFIPVKLLFMNQVDNNKNNTSSIPTPTLSSSKNVDYKAKFAIFTNGTKRIFTDSMYHNLSTDVYIDSSDPSIVYVKKEGVTWMDFFLTLPFSLQENCLTTGTEEVFCTNETDTLKFYLNGERNDNLLFSPISDGDKVLVSFGSESDEEIKLQLTSFEEDN